MYIFFLNHWRLLIGNLVLNQGNLYNYNYKTVLVSWHITLSGGRSNWNRLTQDLTVYLIYWLSHIVFRKQMVYLPTPNFVWKPNRWQCVCSVSTLKKLPTCQSPNLTHELASIWPLLNNFQRKTGKHCKSFKISCEPPACVSWKPPNFCLSIYTHHIILDNNLNLCKFIVFIIRFMSRINMRFHLRCQLFIILVYSSCRIFKLPFVFTLVACNLDNYFGSFW